MTSLARRPVGLLQAAGAGAQVVLLAALSAGFGLGPVGWLAGTAYTLGLLALLTAAVRRARATTLGPADLVTLARALLVGVVTALVTDGLWNGDTPVAPLVVVATVALVLDAVDGQVARRSGTASALGARFDMEVDAFLVLVLSVHVAVLVGPWVMAIGAMRYAFVAASWIAPWMRPALPARYSAKAVAALQGIVLVVAASEVLPHPLAVTLVSTALALLVWSFGRDVTLLWRNAHLPLRSGQLESSDRFAAMTSPHRASHRWIFGFSFFSGVTGGDDPRGERPVAAWVTTALAGLLVLFALIAPNEISRLTPGAFVRIPVEGVLGVVLLLVLPARARRVVATLAGVALGLLTIVKILDMGFFAVLARPFDLVLDWSLLDSAMEFLTASIGRVGAIGSVVVAAVLAMAVLILMTLSTRRLARLVVRRRTTATRTVTVLAVAWMICAVLGAQIVPDVPVAAGSAAPLLYDRALQVRVGLQDQQTFAAEGVVDAYRDTPGKELLTALRGRDVVVAFVESYGRDAVEDPEFASQVGAVLDGGHRRLSAAGFTSRSAFLTSPVAGGGSWLAHATFLSGMWIDNEQRYRTLVSSDRLTITSAFRRASWRTVAVMPGTTGDWPEAAFYGYDQVYDFRNLGYRGPNLGWATVPDQYTLSAFERLERGRPDRAPLMAEIPLVSSHAPWALIPQLIDWGHVGDGSVFDAIATEVDPPDTIWTKGPAHVRTEYRRSVEYSLNSLISYVETYGDDDLVLIFLGDHQPAPIITGDGASRDVPITIVARDRAVLDRISGWGWQDGLKPGPQAPVWRMDAFRDRFLTAFGP
ncbi:MAG: CDP-alcohol phosphatidyltransferase family protein [Pseudonocardiaceae bacterium]